MLRYSVVLCGVLLILRFDAGYARSGSRIKVSLTGATHLTYTVRRFSGNICQNIAPVDKSKLTKNIEKLQQIKLWSSTSVYKSAEATKAINDGIMKFGVPGLNGTVRDVLDRFRASNCFSYFWGGVVRDLFIGVAPNDADVEVSCTPDKALAICTKAFGAANCRKKSTSEIVHVGRKTRSDEPEEMDVAPQSGGLDVETLTDLEYSANAMAYDTNGNDLIIDVSGKGVTDACAKKVQIPTAEGSTIDWDRWTAAAPVKIIRFWKMRYKKFTAATPELKAYIVSQMKCLTAKDAKYFQKNYCKFLTGAYNATTGKCRVLDCAAAQEKRDAYNRFLREDLGHFWDAYVNGLAATTTLEPCRGAHCHAGYVSWIALICSIYVIYGIIQ